MRNALLIFICAFTSLAASAQIVNNVTELHQAVKAAQPGDIITMANGTWEDAEILFDASGTAQKLITLKAQEKGKVILTKKSNLRIAGAYLVVDGLVLLNGQSPTSELISFKKDSKVLANNSRLTNCVIDNFNGPERFDVEAWVVLYGKNNRVDHCNFTNKRNQGVTLTIRLNSPESVENNHQVDHNYFGPRQNLGSNGGETLRIGTSHYCMENSKSIVEYNFFDRCNGEVEIISNKSGQNTYRFNTFFECQGTLTMRHGNETLVEGNVFIGNGVPNTGGIRVINSKQTVRNNYLEGLTGTRFRGALTVMNGVPNSPLNRYVPVTESNISNNTLINCSNVELAAGSDKERSVAPKSTTISSSIFYTESGDLFNVYDDISGIAFSDNCVSKSTQSPAEKGFSKTDLTFKRNEGGLLIPQGSKKGIGSNLTIIAATKENTGAAYYKKNEPTVALNSRNKILVKPGLNTLFDAVKKAAAGDIIELTSGTYSLSKVVEISVPITIRSVAKKSASEKATILFETSKLFQLNNGGSLHLSNLKIDGKDAPDSPLNAVVATSKYSMNVNYKLMVDNCDFDNLNINNYFNVVKVAQSTFADSISFSNSTFNKVSGAVLGLDKETDDIGIYNAEVVSIENCKFTNIEGAALSAYRGGTDESTPAGTVVVNHCVFENVGNGKKNTTAASVNLWGVQNAEIKNSVFLKSAGMNFHLTVGEPVNKVHHNAFDKEPQFEVKGKEFKSFENSVIENSNLPLGDDGKKVGI
jgi:poly(beta-D-mannuronate) lyase